MKCVGIAAASCWRARPSEEEEEEEEERNDASCFRSGARGRRMSECLRKD